MNKKQQDLLRACQDFKRENMTYARVRLYAAQWKKYDSMTLRDIDEVVEKLKTLI